MKKLKKHKKEIKVEHDIKCSRVTISSKICNKDKFNELFDLIDNTKDYKNIISQHCFEKLTDIVTDYKLFLKQYKSFPHAQLNSWETQTIFQEIAAHYSETAKRYLNQATFIVRKPTTNINQIASFINSQSYLIQKDYILSDLKVNDKYNLHTDSKKLVLDFHIPTKLKQLKVTLKKHNKNLVALQNSKQDKDTIEEIISIEKKVIIINKVIAYYKELKIFSIKKPLLYQRVVELITTKKSRLLSHVHLGEYNTGTHARNFNNGQISIVKDLTNTKYNYFFKIRKSNKLDGREPKNKLGENNKHYLEELEEFNEKNFLYLPLIFNTKKLAQIGKTIDTILTKDNPQILIKSEQLRINQSSRKIHIIFNYEQPNNLNKIIKDSFLNKTNIDTTFENTVGIDVNLKHNLLVDSNGFFYDALLKSRKDNKNKFINNVNEIVLLHSKPLIDRSEKEIYRYEKLLRINESLLKMYLIGIIKDWKAKDILHIVMEDLNFISDKSYYIHENVKIKYSRLSRLLRLGHIKHWIASMAEKQGLFTHFTNPAYTSQECSVCHHISPINRKKQEIFTCTNSKCNHSENADSNVAKVIKNRIVNKNIRYKVGKDNVCLCSRNKILNYKHIKKIIVDEYLNNGVVTELSLNKSKDFKTKKDGSINLYTTEASSFRAM